MERERERDSRCSKFPNEFHEFPTKFQIGVKTITIPIQSFPNSRIIMVTPPRTFDFHQLLIHPCYRAVFRRIEIERTTISVYPPLQWNEDIPIYQARWERKKGNGERGGGWFRGMDTTGLYGHGNGYSAIACNPISTDAIYPIYHTLLSGALSTPAAALDRLTLVLIEFAQRGVALRAFRPTMFFHGARGARGRGGRERRERLTDDDDDDDNDVRPASREESQDSSGAAETGAGSWHRWIKGRTESAKPKRFPIIKPGPDPRLGSVRCPF